MLLLIVFINYFINIVWFMNLINSNILAEFHIIIIEPVDITFRKRRTNKFIKI